MTWWNSNKKARSDVAAVEDDRAPVFGQHALYRWVNQRKEITSSGGTEELVSRLSFAPPGLARRYSSIPAINRRAFSQIPRE